MLARICDTSLCRRSQRNGGAAYAISKSSCRQGIIFIVLCFCCWFALTLGLLPILSTDTTHTPSLAGAATKQSLSLCCDCPPSDSVDVHDMDSAATPVYRSPFAAESHRSAEFSAVDIQWSAGAMKNDDLPAALEAKVRLSDRHVSCPSSMQRYGTGNTTGANPSSPALNESSIVCRRTALSTERSAAAMHLSSCENQRQQSQGVIGGGHALTKGKTAVNLRHRLLCITYTVEKSHEKAAAMYKTWGTQCDQHLIFTNGHSIDGVPQEAVVHSLPTFGEEIYNNIWQKLRSIHAKIVGFRFPATPEGSIANTTQLRIRPFDYIFVGGDDVFLFVPNLRRYLMEHSYPQQMEREGGSMLMGYRHDPGVLSTTPPFISGAGYVMNEFAWFLLVDIAVTSCHQRTVVHAEDVCSAECLGQWGVEASDARDEWGDDRFLIMSINQAAAVSKDYNMAPWFREYRDRQVSQGTDILSQYVALVHYIQPGEAQRYFDAYLAINCR